MIKKYNEFINEGIFDLLSGYSMDEVKDKLKRLSPLERFNQLKKINLKYEDVYTKEEIDNFTGLDKFFISNKIERVLLSPLKLKILRIEIRYDEDMFKYGYVGINGNQITPFKYDYIWDMTNNIGKVKIDGKYGYVNDKGIEITPIKYDYGETFYTDKAGVELNGKFGYIDKDGNEYWD